MSDNKIVNYMRSQSVIEKFSEMVGNNNAMHYIGSVLLAVANNPALQECTPQSIYTAAMQAAVLNLSCDPNIGHAYLVPYGKSAKLIVGYKGLHALAVSTGKYRYINVAKVYEGESVEEDRITGFMKFTGGKKSNTIIGYIGAFEMTNGYAKTIYMSVEEIHEIAQKYSHSYNRQDSAWKTSTIEMEKKTVLRQLLRKWGVLDPTTALLLDEIDERNHEIDAIDISPDTVEYVEPERLSEDQALADLGFEPSPQQETIKQEKTIMQKRPYPPEIVKEELTKLLDSVSNKLPTDAQLNLLRYGLEMLFEGDANAEDKRHCVLQYLTGYKSTKDIDGRWFRVLIDKWLKMEKAKDGSGDYVVDKLAIQEAQAIVSAALKAEGQQKML